MYKVPKKISRCCVGSYHRINTRVFLIILYKGYNSAHHVYSSTQNIQMQNLKTQIRLGDKGTIVQLLFKFNQFRLDGCPCIQMWILNSLSRLIPWYLYQMVNRCTRNSNLLCLRHLIRLRAATNMLSFHRKDLFSLMRAQQVLSHHLI